MKTRWTLWIMSLLWTGLAMGAGPRAARWRQFQAQLEQRAPASAVAILDEVVPLAVADRAWAEAAKGMAYRALLTGSVETSDASGRIRQLQKELGRAPVEVKPILETILAHWFWRYFDEHRWQYLGRTEVAGGAETGDLATWGRGRILAEVERHFTAALGAESVLKMTPVIAWTEFLEPGTLPPRTQPTLYDFVVREALAFHAAGEQAGARPEDWRPLSSEQPALGRVPLFGTVAEFLVPGVGLSAAPSSAERALMLHRDLLAFHRDETERSALAEADFGRLEWAVRTAEGPSRDRQFEAALRRFIGEYTGFEVTARARARLARLLHEQGDEAGAHAVASAVPELFRDTPGGRDCRNLVAQIELPSLSISTERVWGNPGADIEVRARNLDRVHFRLVPWDWEVFLSKEWPRPEALRPEHWDQILKTAPAKTWSVDLPPGRSKYDERVLTMTAPGDVPPGFHFVVAGAREDFEESANQISGTSVWVSRLALVFRNQPGGLLDGFVLESGSGEPVPGAEVEAWRLARDGTRIRVPAVRTDVHGRFQLPLAAASGHVVRARAGADAVAWSRDVAPMPPPVKERREERTLLFTDRSLYRPGQLVQYKGIVHAADREANQYAVLAGRSVGVVFRDVNADVIARATHRCNDLGSFSGSFVAPRDRLAGSMEISIENGPPGSVRVNVEEYKRPKFEVTLDPPQDAVRLGRSVALTGRARTYTGAAVDGAVVKYRVARMVRFPEWCWWRPAPLADEVQVAHGEARTAADGTFQIRFVAHPDEAVPAADSPVFRFSVTADVTDTAGETRSAETRVSAGTVALEATVGVSEWQTYDQPVKLALAVSNLSGQPQAVTATVRIRRLAGPAKVQRPPSGEAWMSPPRQAWMRGLTNDASRIEHWVAGELVSERDVELGESGKLEYETRLMAGAYRVEFEVTDPFGAKLVVPASLVVSRLSSDRFSTKLPHWVAARSWVVEPGGEFQALWGTGYDSGRAFVEIEHRGSLLQSFWTEKGITQREIRQKIDESMRGGLVFRVTQVAENRAHLTVHRIEVPWTSKQLTVRWETFRSKLQPGKPETWSLVIEPGAPGGGSPGAFEVAAAMFDASLDQFLVHRWASGFQNFRFNGPVWHAEFGNAALRLPRVAGGWRLRPLASSVTPWRFPEDIRFEPGAGFRSRMSTRVVESAEVPAAAMRGLGTLLAAEPDVEVQAKAALAPAEPPEEGAGQAPPSLEGIGARRNLRETAFFLPQLVAGPGGAVRLEFTVPEALTRWNILAFAHDAQLRAGLLKDTAVTAKDLMVQPNPPRFLREGDELEFPVKILNASDASLEGRVRLNFRLLETDQPADALLGVAQVEQAFSVPARESRSVSWRVKVPEGLGPVAFKVVGAAATLSDGEEGVLAVLPRRVLVSETLPLAIRDAGVRQLVFSKLAESANASSLRHERLTVQMASNPAWYAVMALPYLMEFPHECAEQTFNRYYANALAAHLAQSDPAIRAVFDAWRNTPALDSPLERNEELKSVLLAETPWVRQARSESLARRQVGQLFDAARVREEVSRALATLRQLQLGDGLWPWFPGGQANEYISLYLATGAARLTRMGIVVPEDLFGRAWVGLDAWMAGRHASVLGSGKPGENHLDEIVALYLYGRSFALKSPAAAGTGREALEYFVGQAGRHWMHLSRQGQAHVAIALHRWGDRVVPPAIVKSLRERAVNDPVEGMTWREDDEAWAWHQAPIETQAMMIEVFDEVGGDTRVVEDLQAGLLKRKQTTNWKSTKATADAVYALVGRGADLLGRTAAVEINLGGIDLTPWSTSGTGLPRSPAVEAGTGYFERQFAGAEVTPALAQIRLQKSDRGVAWGGVHWQYLEDLGKVTASARQGLSVSKRLFRRQTSAQGRSLKPAEGAFEVGDEIVVRIELRSDRPLEYVHLKDQRGTGLEPVQVLSGPRYQDGLRYYESTRDTASHFFIEWLPRGTYVFEYPLRVQHRGRYQAGMAEIQCMYAPEFSAHSENVAIEAR